MRPQYRDSSWLLLTMNHRPLRRDRSEDDQDVLDSDLQSHSVLDDELLSTQSGVQSVQPFEKNKFNTNKRLEQAYRNWLASKKSPEKLDEVIEAARPVMNAAIRTYSAKETDPLVRSRAKLLLVQALHRYNPKSGASLKTYLFHYFKGLSRQTGESAFVIRVPESIRIKTKILNDAEKEFIDRNGREPSDAELADETGFSLKTIQKIRQATSFTPEAVFDPRADQDENTINQPGVQIVGRESRISPYVTLVYYDSSPQDRIIMEHTLGLHGKKVLSKQQIARKLRISPAAVSQRAAAIQKRINELEKTDTLH